MRFSPRIAQQTAEAATSDHAAAQAELAQISDELRQAQQKGEELAAAATTAEAEVARIEEELNTSQIEMQHIMSALQQSEAERQAGKEAVATLAAREEELAAAQQQIAGLTSGLSNANANLKALHADFNSRNVETEQWLQDMIAAAAEKSNANLMQIQEKLSAATAQIEALNASVSSGDAQAAP